MIVLRIEHSETKDGVYRGQNKIGFDHNDVEHPNPYQDGLLEDTEYRSEYIFGFKSTEQLNNWFNKEDRKELARGGFNMCFYEVKKKHIRISNHQLMFIEDKAERIASVPINI